MANVKKFIMPDGAEVTMGSGDKRLTLLATVTTTEDVRTIDITQTDDGTPLEVLNITKFVVLVKYIKFVESTNYNYYTLKFNDVSPMYSNWGLSATDTVGAFECEFTAEGRFKYWAMRGNSNQGVTMGSPSLGYSWLHLDEDRYAKPLYSENEILKKVEISHSSNGLLASGLKIGLYAYI